MKLSLDDLVVDEGGTVELDPMTWQCMSDEVQGQVREMLAEAGVLNIGLVMSVGLLRPTDMAPGWRVFSVTLRVYAEAIARCGWPNELSRSKVG